jgi:hypothetical protein
VTRPSNGRYEDEREHFCRNCGRWLMATTVPFGTPGVVRVVCRETACRTTNAVRIGDAPLLGANEARASRTVWASQRHLDRRVGTTL